MNEEETLARKSSKLIFSEIIKTENLTENFCEEFLIHVRNKHSYSSKEYTDGTKHWRGFTQNYIYSYRTKQRTKNKQKIYYPEKDKGINEITIKNPEKTSPIHKVSYVIIKNANSNPIYVDIFLMPKIDLICIVGAKDNINLPKKILKDYLTEKRIIHDEINLNHNTLLWLLWKTSSENELSQGLLIDSFENLQVSSHMPRNDNISYSIKTEGTGENTPSLPICYGIFNDRKLNYFRGEFEYNKKYFILNIDVYRRDFKNKKFTEANSVIHILAKKSLEDVHYSKRLDLTLPFIYSLANVIIKWNESSEEEQLPPEEYIDELWKKTEDDFEDTFDSFKRFKKEYCNKIKNCKKLKMD